MAEDQITVHRGGKVGVNGEYAGGVDKMAGGLWAAFNASGRSSGARYRSRRDAVAAVVAMHHHSKTST
jgi:hypothetical protein